MLSRRPSVKKNFDGKNSLTSYFIYHIHNIFLTMADHCDETNSSSSSCDTENDDDEEEDYDIIASAKELKNSEND